MPAGPSVLSSEAPRATRPLTAFTPETSTQSRAASPAELVAPSRPLLFQTPNPDGWPDWLEAAFTRFEKAKLSQRFNAAVVQWTEFERLFDFESKVSLIPISFMLTY